MNRLLAHFGFKHHPFERAVGKEALLRHRGFDEALERLRFTLELHGLALLLAESGCGKSLLLGELAEEVRRQGVLVHYHSHSTIGPFSFVNVLARKLGKAPRRSRGETAELVSQTMLEDGRSHLLVVDEAHELPDATLEDLRLLTIADFDRRSPFLLLLSGHPSLDDRLAEPIHHALDQRVTTVARLQPLSEDETRTYLETRISAASTRKQTPIFDDGARDAIFEASGGIPRRINQVATSSLIVAASRQQKLVSAQDVQDARLDRGRP